MDTVELYRAKVEDKAVLRQLLELYAYDFTEFDGADVDEHGLFGYHRLDHYWTDEGRYPFLVRVAGKWAGLALVRDVTAVDGSVAHSMAEFFLMRKYRRHGIGEMVARHLFDMFPGPWEVGQITTNLPAQAFWRVVIGRYTGGRFEEVHRDDWDGPMQTFVSEGATE